MPNSPTFQDERHVRIFAGEISQAGCHGVCADGEILCPTCVRNEAARIYAVDPECPDDNQWRLVGSDPSDTDEVCAHCAAIFVDGEWKQTQDVRSIFDAPSLQGEPYQASNMEYEARASRRVPDQPGPITARKIAEAAIRQDRLFLIHELNEAANMNPERSHSLNTVAAHIAALPVVARDKDGKQL